MKIKPAAGILAIVVLGVSACDSASTSKSSAAATSTPGSTVGGNVLDLSNATAAKTVSTDKTVTLSPKLYNDKDNPCAAVKTSDLLGNVAPPCAAAWIQLNAESMPGQDVINNAPTPKQAALATGLDAGNGTTTASAYYATMALELWSIQSGTTSVISVIDGPARPADALYGALTVKPAKSTVLPDCAFPTRIRVAAAGPDVQAHMVALGWPQPSPLAVVATYDKCDGIVVTAADGSSQTLLAHTQPVSIVTTGHVSTVSPFGTIWVTDGWAPCGSADLALVCP